MLLSTFTANACAEQHTMADASNVLRVSDAILSYSQEDGRNIITTIGTIKNLSSARADELVVEIKYFDRNKTLVDSVTQPLFGIVVPPGQDVSFRIRDSADKPKAAYATNIARVVSAEQRTTPNPQNKNQSSLLTDLFISWAPMLFLIGVWIYFMRKMNRKDSPQKRTLELIELQNVTLARQAEAIERLVTIAEKVTLK